MVRLRPGRTAPKPYAQSPSKCTIIVEDGQAALTIKAAFTPGVPDGEKVSPGWLLRCEELLPDEEKVNLKQLSLAPPLPQSIRSTLERPRARHVAAMNTKGNSATINSRLVYPPVMQPAGVHGTSKSSWWSTAAVSNSIHELKSQRMGLCHKLSAHLEDKRTRPTPNRPN